MNADATMSAEERIEQRLVDESHDSACPAAGLHPEDRSPEDACECWADDVNTLLDLLAARDIELRAARTENESLRAERDGLVNMCRGYERKLSRLYRMAIGTGDAP